MNKGGCISMKYASLVLFSNAIFDSVVDRPFPGGVAISGSKILYVGAREDVEQYIGLETLVRECGEKMIMPGICDGHAHLIGTATKQYAEVASGLDKYTSELECVKAVKAFAEKHPGTARIFGTGWLLTNWGHDPKRPSKASLDETFPTTPVYLLGTDGHSLWMNSRAIEECNLEEIVRQNPDAPPDLAPRDEDGSFTGFIAEKICHIVNRFAESYSSDEIVDYQRRMVKLLNSFGMTGFTDVSPIPSYAIEDYIRPLSEMEENGELTVRFYFWAGNGPSGDSDIEDALNVKALGESINSDKLRIAGLKTLADGIPFTHTASMLEEYSDNPGVRGDLLHPREVYHEWITAVNKIGFAVKIHCCGDAAVRMALDGFEKSNAVNDNRELRNAVEHMDIVSDEDIPRFNELGVVASVQPAHVVMGRGIYSVRIGDRARLEWNFRRLINAGAAISIGTDSPVVDFNPFVTIYKAITRKDTDGAVYSPYTLGQEMTLPEALKGYTTGAAFASNMEQKTGTLEAGKYADIAILDRNLFEIPADEIKDCHVLCTVFNGQIVYEA